MTSDQTVSAESATPDSTGRNGKRLIAGIIGTIALGFLARYTFGVALIAPLGIAIAWWFARRAGRRLSGTASWVAAVTASLVAILAAAGFASTQLPPGFMSKVQQATDSAEAHPQPPPAWLERIAPGSTARANAQASNTKGTMSIGFLLFGATILIGMLSGFLGTVGWLATLPLVYAITGRWIGSGPRDPPTVEESVPG